MSLELRLTWMAGALACLLSVGALVYEHRLSSILRGDYERSALCKGDWWTNRAERRAKRWATVRISGSNEVLKIPLFRFEACLQIEDERLQDEARTALEAMLSRSQDAAHGLFDAGLQQYLDKRYDGIDAAFRNLKDTGRTLSALIDGWEKNGFEAGVHDAWNESGTIQIEDENKRLSELYDPAVAAFSSEIVSYFSDHGPFTRSMEDHPRLLLAGAIHRELNGLSADTSTALVAAGGSPPGDGGMKVQETPSLGSVPNYVAGVAADAALDAAIVGRSLLAGASRAAAAAIIVPVVVAKIDEALNRKDVERARRADLQIWLADGARSARAWHAAQVRNYHRAVREWLVKAACTDGLVVERRSL